MSEFKFEIKEELGMLSENEKSGYAKELNLVSWNGGQPKYDIREWDETHEKCRKGITLTKQELKELKDILNDMDI